MKRVIVAAICVLLISSSVLSLTNPCADANDLAREFSTSFLTNVIGISNFSTISYAASNSNMLNSQHVETTINQVIRFNGSDYEILIVLVDGKFHMFDLSSALNPFSAETSTDYQSIAKSALLRYGQSLNSDHYNGLAEMISTASSRPDRRAEDDYAVLNISYAENSSVSEFSRRYASFRWTKKIGDQFAFQQMSIEIDVSRNGLVTTMFDTWTLYYVASTNVTISKEQAVSLATPDAQDYAQEHGQSITSMNASFTWLRDSYRSRGDDFAVYPAWGIFATFDKVNNESVGGYTVGIWADNGQIFDKTPTGGFFQTSGESNVYGLMIMVAAIVVLLLILVVASFRRKPRVDNRKRPYLFAREERPRLEE